MQACGASLAKAMVMSTSSHIILGALSALTCLSSCVSESNTTTPEGLSVEQRDDARIRGAFRVGDSVIRFEAEMPRPLVGVATVMIGDAQLRRMPPGAA